MRFLIPFNTKKYAEASLPYLMKNKILVKILQVLKYSKETKRVREIKSIIRSCNELQANLIMIQHYVELYHKIPNQNFMSIVKLKYIYVY
jgi:hypothetical protein